VNTPTDPFHVGQESADIYGAVKPSLHELG